MSKIDDKYKVQQELVHIDFKLFRYYNLRNIQISAQTKASLMAKPNGLIAIIFLVSLGLTISSTAFCAAAVGPKAVAMAQDERQIQNDREQALFEALAAVDPSLKEREGAVENVEPGEEALRIKGEVTRLREKRKNQFKSLPWSHIKRAITPQSILNKEQFLGTQNKNLSLVLDRAVKVHVPAQVALERMTLARFRIAKAVREFFPEANFEGTLEKGELSGFKFNSKKWKFKFKQPVFRGGILWNTLLLEWSNLEISKRDYDRVLSDLIADVSTAYFEYERARNVLQERTKLFETAKEQKRVSDEKNAANLIAEIEKLNTDSLYSQAQYDLETAQQELEVAELDLQKFLNLEPQDPINVNALYDLNALHVDGLKDAFKVNGPEGPAKFENDLERLVELSYQNRPDLQVESSKLKATQFAYRVALGKQLPQLDAIMEFGKLAEAFNSDSESPTYRGEFRVGMEASYNLGGNTLKYSLDRDKHAPSVTQFQSGQGTKTLSNTFSVGLLDDLGQFSSIIEAKVNSLEQVVELEKTERDVIREVKEAYFNFNKALIQVESTYKRMNYRDRLVQLAKHRLGTNEIQISEFLQANMDLTEERSLVYKALSDFFTAQAKLNKAIGIRDYMPMDALQ